MIDDEPCTSCDVYRKLKDKEDERMIKEEFKLELEKHNLTVNEFCDLRDAWYELDYCERLELLKEEMIND